MTSERHVPSLLLPMPSLSGHIPRMKKGAPEGAPRDPCGADDHSSRGPYLARCQIRLLVR